jgi:hypothetical protein
MNAAERPRMRLKLRLALRPDCCGRRPRKVSLGGLEPLTFALLARYEPNQGRAKTTCTLLELFALMAIHSEASLISRTYRLEQLNPVWLIPRCFTEIGTGVLPIQDIIDTASKLPNLEYMFLEQDHTTLPEIESSAAVTTPSPPGSRASPGRDLTPSPCGALMARATKEFRLHLPTLARLGAARIVSAWIEGSLAKCVV